MSNTRWGSRFAESWHMSKRIKIGENNTVKHSEHVASSPQDVCPLLNGMRIPQVTLGAADAAPFDLAELISTKPTVLVFYRGGW